MTRPLISVVMPAHNEAASIGEVVREVEAVLSRWPHELIVVDDGSTDDTWSELQTLHSTIQIRAVRLTRNFGHQAALAAGLRCARGAGIVMMDSDGQHPPRLLPEMIRVWQQGYPVVQTVRTECEDEGWLKRQASGAFYRVWSILSGVEVVHGTADFRLIDRQVLDAVLGSGGSLTYLRGLIPWLGFKTRYLEFRAARRLAGIPGYTWRRSFKLCIDGLTAFSIVPLRVAMALGAMVAASAFTYLCYVVLIWWYSNRVVSGWASIAGLVALIGGIQLFTIGVLGEYIGRIFLRTMDRPQFVISRVLDETTAGTQAGSEVTRTAVLGRVSA